MTWQSRTSSIQTGDKVALSARFCRSTGQQTGDAPFARGVVKEIANIGPLAIAVIAWDTNDMPERVNVANLSRVTDKGVMDRD